jgi:hypothetical protein
MACAAFMSACEHTPPPVSLGERAIAEGLDAAWWIVDDSNNDRTTFESLTQALLPYAKRPTGLTEDQQAAWRANGLRVIAVPVKDLDALHDRLRTSGKAREQFLGIVPEWTSLGSGHAFATPWTLKLDNGPLDLPPGQVRLLCRAWLVPDEPPLDPSPANPIDATGMAAAMHLELLPQHQEASSTRESLAQAYGLDKRPTNEGAGLTFPRLALSLKGTGTDALLIVPESPDVEWVPLPPGTPRVLPEPVSAVATVQKPIEKVEPISDDPFPPQASRPASLDTPPPVEVMNPAPITPVGPAPTRLPTFGEALLSDLTGVGLSRRVVIVLIPRVPSTFQLIER